MKNSLISLAKGDSSKKTAPAPKKPLVKKPVPKVVEKPKSKEEVRDEKAKETVEKLLQNVELTSKVEMEEGETETHIDELPRGEGIEWLEEQLTALTEENERLRSELDIAKEDYARLFEKMQGGGVNSNASEPILQNVLFFFNEMQANYLGMNPQGIRFTVAYPERLLPKLIQLFPFLENYRKF
jgi:hypothetical protein